MQSPVLAGILVGGEHPKDIRFFELPHSDTDAIIPRNATISISSENAEVESLNLEGGVYATQEGLEFHRQFFRHFLQMIPSTSQVRKISPVCCNGLHSMIRNIHM